MATVSAGPGVTYDQPTASAIGAIPDTEKGAPNGVATLGPDGRIPSSELSIDALEYKGSWNAATNTPTLANGVGTTGDTYAISVGGSRNLGAGVVVYVAGSLLIYNGTVWDQIESGNAATPANPTALVGTAAINGVAQTLMRSDAAPAINQAMVPTWTGAHTFTAAENFFQASGGLGPVIRFTKPDAPADQKNWRFIQTDVGFGLYTASDLLGNTTVLNFIRSGAVITSAASNVPLWTHNGSFAVTGNAYVAGQLGSAANTSAPSPTNSGITLGGSPTWAMQSFYDQSVTANNRTADLLFITNSIKFRFANDARSAFLDVLSINGGQALGVTGITSTSGSGAWAHTGDMTVSGSLTANGVQLGPIASTALINQSADATNGALYAVTADGTYRANCYIVLTRAATTSATLPGCSVSYTDLATNVAMTSQAAQSAVGNVVGTHLNGVVVFEAKSGTNIGFSTTGYASSGATTMQYRVRIVVERLQ